MIRVTAVIRLRAPSPFGAPSRLSPKAFQPRLSPVPRFMVADNRSAPRAASSWQTGVVAGRASFRTARVRCAKPHAGAAPRSTFRIASGMCPWTSEMGFFSSPRGTDSSHSAAWRHASDLMRIFFALSLLPERGNCDSAALIRFFLLRCGDCGDFRIVAANAPSASGNSTSGTQFGPHSEAAATRPSKDEAEAPWPRPSRLAAFVGEHLRDRVKLAEIWSVLEA
jgi:hypothetical protein